jgi:hypothetical protein
LTSDVPKCYIYIQIKDIESGQNRNAKYDKFGKNYVEEIMKKRTLFAFLVVLLAVSFAVAKMGELKLKAGDTAYICNCGETCDCGSIAMVPGKCVCGADMIQATVARVEDGKAVFLVNGKDRAVPLTGKYVCACGEKCPCKMISQKPGKCTCGKEMMEVK